MRLDIYLDQSHLLTQEKKMNKEELFAFMVKEFESANKTAMMNSGMTEQDAETKNAEYSASINFLLAQVVEKMFEKNIF